MLTESHFSLFINEIAPTIEQQGMHDIQIASTIEQQGMHGIQLLPGLIEVFLLLFADDIVLIPDTPKGLQTQLDVLSSACKGLFLGINIDKQK